MDDSQTVVLVRGSFNIALDFTRAAFRGMFIDKSTPPAPLELHIIRMACQEGKTSVSFSFGNNLVFASDGGDKITYRIDDQPAKSQRFEIFHKNDRLMLSKGSVAFIKRLIGAKKLIVRMSPYRKEDITNEFRLDGLENSITALRQACRW